MERDGCWLASSTHWTRALPIPFLRRPALFRRMNAAMRDCITHAPAGTLASAFRDLPNGPEELRVAVSAGYDTTAHTLAWLLSHVAQQPELRAADRRSTVINEILRLYPAGWVGSRRCTADVEFGGLRIRRGALVLYSPTSPIAIRGCGPIHWPSGPNGSPMVRPPGVSFRSRRASAPAWGGRSRSWC